MDIFVWFEFIITITLLMLIARRSLWVALGFSALVLGLVSIPFLDLSVIVSGTIFDPSIVLLAVSVGLIAVIGGALEMTGLIDELMSNTSLKRRPALLVIPAMLGMLPIPGGALLSAPVVQRGAGKADADIKASINVWSRHVAVLFYPLGSLLATTKMAGLDLYEILLYMVPGLVLTIVLTWIFLLRKVDKGRMTDGKRIRKKAAIPVLLILSAPAVHASLMYLFPSVMEEVFLLLGVSLSLALILIVKRKGPSYLVPVARRMKAWNFALIIMAMFIFLGIFNASDAPDAISTLPLTRPLLVVLAGGLLGVATGRINVPISIMLPILSTGTLPGMDNITFTILFFSIFIGFLISPVHPCVSVSLEYFRTDYLSTLKRTMIPASIAWFVSLGAALILI
jgi:integral membrane protein (TIGR00529 family)